MTDNDIEYITIPTPLVRPFDIPIDMSGMVHEVWDAFVAPEQEKYIPQSVEMRMLMAILRSLHDGLHEIDPCVKCVEIKEL